VSTGLLYLNGKKEEHMLIQSFLSYIFESDCCQGSPYLITLLGGNSTTTTHKTVGSSLLKTAHISTTFFSTGTIKSFIQTFEFV